MKKWMGIFLAMTLAAGTVTGCGGGGKAETTKAAAGQEMCIRDSFGAGRHNHRDCLKALHYGSGRRGNLAVPDRFGDLVLCDDRVFYLPI